MRLWLIVLALIASVRPATAAPKATVALLPLDTDHRLEIYGQPVASEIARALTSPEIELVVIGAKMAVPERATLIVDGTITAKGDNVTIALRVRKRVDGTTLDTLSASAPLAELDKAAGDLAARLLPSVKKQLAALEPPPIVVDTAHPPPPPASAKPRPLLIGAIASTGATGVDGVRAALIAAMHDWATAHARVPQDVDGKQLAPALAVKAVAGSGADLAIAFEVARLDQATRDGVPIVRARVRVRVVSAAMVLFDRVVSTDSIVGKKGATPDELAALVAREVLQILRPHLRKIGGWT